MTCPRCKHTASVEEFRQDIITLDGVRITRHTCPNCGALRTERRKV